MDLAAHASHRRSWLGRIQWLIGLAAAVALVAMVLIELFAWLLPQRLADDGRWYVRLAAVSMFVRVFQLYAGSAALAISAVLLASGWRRTAAAAVVTAVVLLTPYARDFMPKHPPAAVGPTFRLMSINLYFQNRDEAAIVRAIRAADPDVLVLVEVTPWSFENVITKHLLGEYQYVAQPRVEGTGVVLSRLPARLGEAPKLADGSVYRRPVLINVSGAEIAIYAVHLISPGRARLVERNREQVTLFTEVARVEPRPMIIAGDCNFTQLTPNAAALRRAGLRTTHDLIGFGLGHTWGPRWWPTLYRLPGVRIDHIWLSPQLTATSHAVGPDTGSDHRPIIADIGISARR